MRFRVTEADLSKEQHMAPVCFRMKTGEHFYVNLSHFTGQGRWMCHVWGLCLWEDGYRASIKAQV